MASGLSRQVLKIENNIALLGAMHDRLRYLQPPMGQLIEAMAAMAQFSTTEYLVECKNQMRQGCNFPESWRIAVLKHGRDMGKGQGDILLPLGDVLGCTDLESQLTALLHVRAMLENRLEEARADRDKHARLYQSLGVLSGIAIVILLV